MASSWFLDPNNLLSLAKAIFGLGVVIFVHELGHFLVAKACGVKCEKFYIGFDVPISFGPFRLPAALWRFQWGETEYGIGAIPLGGYVKMLGQDDNPANSAAEAERIRIAKESPDGGNTHTLDPRSYPAKSVPQRMAIISAGVIMNLIFGVIFGAVAYWMGVPFEPATVGRTVPGDSAWVNGLQYGDEFLQFNRDGRRDEHMRFNDLRLNVGAKNDAGDLEVLIRRPGADPEERWITLRSKIREGEAMDLPTIGLTNQSSLKFAGPIPWDTKSPVATSNLKDGDLIKSVKITSVKNPVKDYREFEQILRIHSDQPVTLVVTRAAGKDQPPTEEEVLLAAQPDREFGLRMVMGPIAAIRKGSPAESSGFAEGDVVTEIDGQAIEDALHIDDVFAKSVGKVVPVTVTRDGATQELTVTPQIATTSGAAWGLGRPMAAETIGIAYFVTDTVDRVLSGSPAAEHGMKTGDRITKARFLWTEAAGIDKSEFNQAKLNKLVEFDAKKNSWAGFVESTERMPLGTAVEFTYEREGVTKIATYTPRASDDQFVMDRGLIFYPVMKTRRAASFSDAWRLGWRETKESAMQIFLTLKRFSKFYKHIGGPGTIVMAATQEASQGLPRLLLFLTLLSANLAILNFLPIPVLDGGHIMFLIYEGVFGKPMPERIAILATMAGLGLILSLMIFAISMDVYRFLL